MAYNAKVRVLLSHSEARPFEVERFTAAWRRGGGQDAELHFVTPGVASDDILFADAAGIILSGGPDVEPQRYGAAPDPGVELHLDPTRDAFDLGLLAAAERFQLPVFGICYGCQILAVAGGGTLIQDLPGAGWTGHHVATPKDHLAHDVAIAPEARFLAPGGRTLAVNSRHHQAVATLGARWRVVGCAADGVIEAIEPVNGDRFVLGVQWHPENIADADHDALFTRFRAACRARAGEA